VFYIAQKNWDKILGYAEEAYDTEKSEIGGMSVMVEDEDGDWELKFPVILKQEISGSNTILDKDALAVYYTKQAKRMGKKNFRFCWWHSHHTMSAFWSSTDIKAIDEFNEGDFSFALVVNLKGEYKFRVSMWKPFEVHQDVELDITGPGRITKAMSKEVEELCSKHTYGYSWKKEGNVWKNGYSYKSNSYLLREAAEDPRQERIPFRSTAGQIAVSGNKKSFTEIVQEVDDINGELTDGTIKYKEYTEAIDELNNELKNEKSLYKVNIIKEAQKDDLLYVLPAQLVVYADGEEVAGAYDDFYGWGGY
jgi:hypothetical protein